MAARGFSSSPLQVGSPEAPWGCRQLHMSRNNQKTQSGVSSVLVEHPVSSACGGLATKAAAVHSSSFLVVILAQCRGHTAQAGRCTVLVWHLSARLATACYC